MNRSDVAAALRLLSEVAASRQADLDQYDDGSISTESDTYADSDAPIMEQFVIEGGSEAVHQMTNFTSRGFDMLYGIVKDHAESSWYGGRGKKSSFSAKDVFFMLLKSLKHGGQ